MKTVDIAMATYNGEKFLEEQILSIQKQTYTNWNLYISDDGSSDDTVNIVRKMANKDHRIKLINTERQGGVVNNFNCVLKHMVSEYVALSDQDDIWPENRLDVLIAEIQKHEQTDNQKGILVFSDLELIDQYGHTLASSFYEVNRLDPQDNLKDFNLIWISTVYGCSTIMNRKLLDVALPIPDTAQMHDQWLALKAQKNNGLYYLNFKTIKYRQHANNVVGGSVNTTFNRVKNINKYLKNIRINAKNIINNLKENEELYLEKKYFLSKKYLFLFVFREVFPNIFLGKKKIYTLFLFIFLLVNLI